MSILIKKMEDGTFMPTTAGYTLLVILMIVILILGNLIFNRGKKLSARQIAFSAMAIALGFLTSNIKLIKMPMGGSVTLLSMLFIALIGYWFGTANGIMAGIAYGILQLLIDPYILSFPQMLTDYILAFGALGLCGLFSKSRNGLIKGYIAAVLGRYFFAFLSGWIFFGMYASDYGFKSGVVYSLAYNGAYLGLEAAITLVVLAIPSVRRGFETVKHMAVGE